MLPREHEVLAEPVHRRERDPRAERGAAEDLCRGEVARVVAERERQRRALRRGREPADRRRARGRVVAEHPALREGVDGQGALGGVQGQDALAGEGEGVRRRPERARRGLRGGGAGQKEEEDDQQAAHRRRLSTPYAVTGRPCGVTSAATATSAKATIWTPSSTPPASASPKTTIPPVITVMFAAVARAGDDRDGLALLEAAGGGEEGEHRGQRGDRQPRRGEELERAADARQRLERDVGDAEQRAGGGAEDRAVVVGGRAEPRSGDQQHAEREHPGLEGDQRGHGERGVIAAGARQREHEQRQAGGGHDHADPLARADLAAEQPLAHHGEHHDAGRERDLDDGQRGERERGHVEDPSAGGDRHADREPARAEQVTGAAQRRAQLDPRGHRGAAVLAQKPELRDGRAQQCEPDTDVQVTSLPFVDLVQLRALRAAASSDRRPTFPWTALWIPDNGRLAVPRLGGDRTGQDAGKPPRRGRVCAQTAQQASFLPRS